MKTTKLHILVLLLFFGIVACKKEDPADNVDPKKGKIIFYTDKDTCGSINIILDGQTVGSISMGTTLPSCDSHDPKTIVVEVNSGLHNYSAMSDCGVLYEGRIILDAGECKTKLLPRPR